MIHMHGYLSLSLSLSIYLSLCVYIYIYICVHRERGICVACVVAARDIKDTCPSHVIRCSLHGVDVPCMCLLLQGASRTQVQSVRRGLVAVALVGAQIHGAAGIVYLWWWGFISEKPLKYIVSKETCSGSIGKQKH